MGARLKPKASIVKAIRQGNDCSMQKAYIEAEYRATIKHIKQLDVTDVLKPLLLHLTDKIYHKQ